MDFVGRSREIAMLQRHLQQVKDGEARLVSVRGRRQVGKSRLVSEFVSQSGLPQLFVTGSRQAGLAGDLESFRQDAALNCTLPHADLLTNATFSTWEQALRAVVAALPTGEPAIVVLDELPWLLERDPGLDGTLQKLWDRHFERLPVLMVLIGSDLSVMEMLTDHARPLYGRAKEMVVNPLNVRDTARMAGIGDDPAGAADAFDAALLTGGYPRLVMEWRRTPSIADFLGAQLADENSEVVTTGRRILDAEFPPDLQASIVLRAVGAGERTFTTIAEKSGINAPSLTRALKLLTEKRVVAADHPLSIRPATKLSRYRIADSYLRFWLRFVEAGLADIQRGRPDLAIARVTRDWPDFRGRAVEPLVREALTRIAVDDPALGGAQAVGGWWPRNNNPEVDLVGVAPALHPVAVPFVGSIKWRETAAFDVRDLTVLASHRAHVPGAATAALVAVTRTTCTAKPDAYYSAADLIKAWR